MEEQKDCDSRGKHILHFYFVKFRAFPRVVRKQEAEKQYQLINLDQLRINKEIDQWKAEEHKINQKLMWFSQLDEQIEFEIQRIKNLECWDLGKFEPSLPIKSAPKTTRFLHLPEKDSSTPIRPNRNRCQKNLIKKGRIDIEYLQLVQEELLSSKISNGMTPCGKQELNDLIESMEQKIQHGNKIRADEKKIYHEIRNLNETKELYTSLEPRPHSDWYDRERRSSKKDVDFKRSIRHKIKLRLEDIEKMKRDQMGRKTRVRRLKAELEYVRKNMKSLNIELVNVNSKRLKAYKRANELGQQKKEMNSCYNEYQSLKTLVKRLARKRDIVGLKQVCNTQVEGFMRQWSKSKACREDYEKRKLV